MLRNTGAGGFEDVTRSSGLLAGRVNEDPDFGRNAQLFAAGDVNNDGILDVFTGISRIDYLDESTETSEIMLGSGDGTFTPGPADSAARFADKSSNPVGASFVDFDLDGNLSSILEPRHPPFPSIAFQKAYFFFLSGKKQGNTVSCLSIHGKSFFKIERAQRPGNRVVVRVIGK